MSDELQQMLDDARWLRPDAEIDRLDDNAMLALHGYADELTACFERFSGRELRPASLFVTRSALAATARWTSVIADGAREGAVADVREWRAAMNTVMEARMHSEEIGPSITDALARFRAHLSGDAVPLPPSWRPAWNLLLPGFFAMHRHVNVGLRLERKDGRGPSPWGPLAALWSRGCWPVLCASGELIVWVPTIRNNAIVVDADVESDKPRRIESAMLYGGEHLPPGRLGIMLAVRSNTMWVQPLAAKSLIQLAGGGITAGSAAEDAIATISYEQVVEPRDRADSDATSTAATSEYKRYFVNVLRRSRLLRNGAEATTFMLSPGDMIEVDGTGGKCQLYYLGASARDAEHNMPTPHD